MNTIRYIRDSRQPWRRLIAPLLLFVLLALVLPASVVSSQSPEPLDLSQATAPLSLSAPLSLAERVTCQRAVEEVYWRHRIWPQENPGPKPALEEVMPASAIAAKVEDNLRQSNALATLRGQPISGQQLQAEMERIAAQSRQPELLRQLWAALNDDPYLVAECLARPVLAHRLLEDGYAQDEGLAGTEQPFAEWWQTARASYDATLEEPAYDYTLPTIMTSGVPLSDDDVWVPTPTVPEETNGTAVWTGTEMIIWGGGSLGAGRSAGGARYNPATDSWTATSLIDAPIGRFEHSAVWTGTEMIVWGGCGPFEFSFCELGDGSRYNPATDTWTPVSNSNDPSARMRHTAIWTGSEMIVWGGCNPLSSGASCAEKNSGGRYDPATDTWAPTSTANVAAARYYHTAVWTGDKMIVWGGYDGLTLFSSGGVYDPATDSWTATSLANAPTGRKDHSAVWSGNEMIVWGGCETPACPLQGSPTNTGGRYDPASNTWTATSTSGAPSARANHTAVWTGQEMVVWGGESAPGSLFNTGGRYDPVANAWTPTSTAGAPEARGSHQVVWTGQLMIVWGGGALDDSRSGGRYHPETDSWAPTNDSDPDSFRAFHTAVWTGAEMIAWGGEDTPFGDFYGSGVIYEPATQSWRDTTLTGAPGGRRAHTAVWTGMEMIVWGGQSGSFLYGTGGRYNPASNSWSPVTTAGAPSSRADHGAVWTGTEMVIWGGNTLSGITNSGGRYNPASNSWTPTTTAGAPTASRFPTAVWTGSEMIVWGGNDEFGNTNTGGRYDPASDSWQLTSLANAPVGRYYHTANWTGSEMVVWGGLQGNFDNPTYLNSGGRYDPATDSWTATSLTGAPSPRARHTAVWSGEEVIVWGGCIGPTNCGFGQYTGGRYDPATDSWHPTAILSPISSAPVARSLHTAVWTGQDMIVWGGLSEEGGYTHTGAHYTPNVLALPRMHVSSVDMAFRAEDGAFRVGARIIVHDESGAGVSDAVVTVEARTPSGATLFADLTTNANGVALASAITNEPGIYTVCVRSVSKSGWFYEFTANEEGCASVMVS